LADKETCCLADIFLPNIESKAQLLDVAELLYRVCKHSLLLPSHQKDTEEVVHKNLRMGIGVSGVQQASEEQNSWLSDCYEYLRVFDAEYSDIRGLPHSLKLTTVKPSGTLSLLPGITPGIHPGFAQFMYRRIRISASHELVNLCKESGYPIEYLKQLDGTEDHNTVVVTFPFRYPDGTRLAKDMTALDQLKEIKRLQTVWSDNSVSCTIYYKREELPAIRAYLEKYYENSHKSLSFLLYEEGGFIQSPFEEITEEAYNELVSMTRPINRITEFISLDLDSECDKGTCPIR